MVELDKINSNFCQHETGKRIDVREIVQDTFQLYKKINHLITDRTLFITLDKGARTIMYTLDKIIQRAGHKKPDISFINFSSRDRTCGTNANPKDIQEADITRYAFIDTTNRFIMQEQLFPQERIYALEKYFSQYQEHYKFDTYDNVIIMDDAYSRGATLLIVKKAVGKIIDEEKIHMVSLYKYTDGMHDREEGILYAKEKNRDNDYSQNFNGVVDEYNRLLLKKKDEIGEIISCPLSRLETSHKQRKKFLQYRQDINDAIKDVE